MTGWNKETRRFDLGGFQMRTLGKDSQMPKANVVKIEPESNITIADWHDRAGELQLKPRGKSLVGPCPACGGTDRFSVEERDGKALLQCRQCTPNGQSQAGKDAYKKILREAGFAVTEQRPATSRRKTKRKKSPLEPAIISGSFNDPFQRKDAITLESVLADSKIDFRWNIRAQHIEYREPKATAEKCAWTAVNDRLMSRIRDNIMRSYYVASVRGPKPLHFGRERWEDSLNTLLHFKEVDPFQEWLELLPAWNGTPVIERILPGLFGADDDQLSRWAARFLFLGAVQRTFEPGCKLDEIPIFLGDQGVGKSTLLRNILPPFADAWFGDGLRWDARQEKQVDAVLGKVIVEVSEMAGRSRADIESIKTFISRRNDNTSRRPYAKHTEEQPRRFILAGTTNNRSDLPNDPSGNRRFVPVELGSPNISVESYLDEVRDNAWAEALVMYHDGERAGLPREIMGLQAERAEEHRDRDDLIEDAVAALPNVSMTLSEVVDRLPERLRVMSERRIGLALRNAGWSMGRVRVGEKIKRLWQLNL